MKRTMLIIAVLLSGLFVVEAEAAPAFQAAGTAVSGTGSVSPAWPAHAVGDVALLFIESTGGQAATLSTPAGFAAVLNSPQSTGAGTSGTRITVYWARATTTTMAAPTVANPGDHVYAQIITYRGVISTGNPWDVTGGGVKAAASFSVTVTGVTTTVPSDLIVQVVSRDNDRTGAEFSAETNASLTGIAERSDGGTTSGNGGGFAVWDGVKATAGATGNTTATISRSTVNAFLTIALRPAVVDHIEIDYPAPPFSTCSPTAVIVYSCADAACTSYYIGGASVTLSPGGNVVVIPAGSSSGSGTVFQSTSGAATLSAVSVPAASGAPTTTCKNTSTGAFSCSVTFAALTVTAPNLTSGNTVAGTISGCTAQVPVGNNTINFYTTYSNPATGTLKATVNATAIGTTAATSTGIILNFTFLNATTNQATFNLSYPDVGLLNLDACKTLTNCTASTASGTDPFTAAPDHFTISSINCVSGCSVVANPGAANAAGAAFMKAGNPFSLTVTAFNSAGVATPNFGKESTPESVSLTAAMIADPDLTTAGVISGAFGAFANGVATGNAFSFDEVGIMTLTARLASASYLGSGLKEITAPATGNIGRFIPDHFTVATDQNSPIVTRTDFPPQMMTTVSAAAAVGATTISVASTTGFNVGDTVRIPNAGTGGNVYIGTLTAVNAVALTLTLNTGIGTALLGSGTEPVIDEWGSYMGESMDAHFILNAVELGGTTTNNYQGAYAKLNPMAAGNPLGFGAVDMAGPTYNLALDTSVTATTGSFAGGSAAIIAPLAVTRGASAVGPYNSVQIGIAPTTAEADGVRMGAYDLGVTSATLDHTSIMDPQIQNVTAVRYGRMKIANANGSELLPLPIALTAQYWNGTTYVTNTNDNNTVLAIANISLGNYQRKAGDTWTTTVALPIGTAAAGVWTATLSKPSATFSGRGSVDVTTTAPTYLPNPPAGGRATFGVYKGANEFIYLRENY